MVFLSTQPDQFYFLWQLKLQLHNFRSLGIPPDQIHVLIGYDLLRGLNPEFASFIAEYKAATFYTYPDLRNSSSYSVSIRPHLIKQHFQQHERFNGEEFLYHDADIFFRAVPDFSLMNDGGWHVADTRSYLNSIYIINYGGREVLEEMCRIVGIDVEKVIANDQHAGGAQYLMRGTTLAFWEKVENDCEALYRYLKSHRDQWYEKEHIQSGKTRSSFKGIHWYAEMWALLWNALAIDKEVSISPELDFCWPNDSIDKWYSKKILHYSGNYKDNKKVFDKNRYRNYPPFHEDFSDIDTEKCSIKIIELIQDYNEECKDEQFNITGAVVCFNIMHKENGEDELASLTTAIRWMNIQFNFPILVLHALPEESHTKFNFPANVTFLNNQAWNTWLQAYEKRGVFVIFNRTIVFDRSFFLMAIEKVMVENADGVLWDRQRIFKTDSLFADVFSKLMDLELLHQHTGKFSPLKHARLDEVMFINSELLNSELRLTASGLNMHIISSNAYAI